MHGTLPPGAPPLTRDAKVAEAIFAAVQRELPGFIRSVVSAEIAAFGLDLPAKMGDALAAYAAANAEALRGAEGPRGLEGQEGREGPPGKPGDAGERGEAGQRGEAGPEGPRGPPGEAGKDGARGLDGQAGQKGEKGDAGEKGEAGPEGPRGPPGEAGERGAPGLPGDAGERGPAGLDGQDGAKGDQGEPGAPGERGERGADGPMGPPARWVEWAPERFFEAGSWALHRNAWWMARESTDSEPPGRKWMRGPYGPEHRGVHDPAAEYLAGALVVRDGTHWFAKRDVAPGEMPGECDAWSLWAPRGKAGKPGERGPQGLPGAAGGPGPAGVGVRDILGEGDGLAFEMSDGTIRTIRLPALAEIRAGIATLQQAIADERAARLAPRGAVPAIPPEGAP